MSAQRKIKRENEQGVEVLTGLIEKFFSLAMKMKNKDNIVALYKSTEAEWMYYANKKNSLSKKKQKSFIMVDAFENTMLKAHKKIIASNQGESTKLAMLRVLRYVGGKSKLKCFYLEFPLWIKHIKNRLINFRNKKRDTMVDPSLNLKLRKN